MTLTLTDFFCGAGGSSTGAIAVPGVEVKVAANHWGLAVEVHNANHQNALHVQADISQYDPRLIPPHRHRLAVAVLHEPLDRAGQAPPRD